jgi:hypothetical protein
MFSQFLDKTETRQFLVVCLCKHGYEPSGSVETKFVGQLYKNEVTEASLKLVTFVNNLGRK